MIARFPTPNRARSQACGFTDVFLNPLILPYKLQFNPADKIPKYKQIVQSVITDIERGVLQNGDQLPSISELSSDAPFYPGFR